MNKTDAQSPKVDPELWKQIEEAEPQNQCVSGVCQLGSQTRQGSRLSPDQVRAFASTLLDRVQLVAGVPAEKVNVLGHLGTVILLARPRFWRILLEQPELASAMANVKSEDILIRPVRKRPVSDE